MLFSKDRQIAFVLPTRCGSTSTKHFLESVGFSQVQHPSLPNNQHIKYLDAVKCFPNLAKYKKYGIFRNPLERFISTVNYLLTGKPLVSPKEFVDCFNKNPNHPLGIFKQPQVNWLDHKDIEVIKFENLTKEIFSVVKVACENKKFPHLNSSSSAKNFSDCYYKIMNIDSNKFNKQTEEFVRDYYAADYQFAKDVLGKEY